MNNNTDWFGKALGNIVKSGVLLFLIPVITFTAGWLGGQFLKWVYGGYVAEGLNRLFNVSYYKPSNLPIFCGVLAVIGGYFKFSANTNNKAKNDEVTTK